MGEWYIIHTLSGSEKRVKQMIIDQIAKNSMSEFFEEIVVPVIEVSEIKRGKSVKTEKKFMPGYILIKMKMTDESWHLVKSVPKITGFLGGKSKPYPLSAKEVKNIFEQLESEKKGVTSAKLYEVGEAVIVTDGPFDSFNGVIDDIDNEKLRLRVSISIFGKATPIDLAFNQVKKV
ncbi:Transcription termination/antitermination protein NusG [Candidatus Trichorickettsia mobilis]|uniref:Transcription termination/antitermination protein NusG n=1 Tax=Candidatus Trichorickettsia mobilis TaxID=1346319 RepID=A0ABZ0UU82_9RICK|nr:transcription termination/antitermination protein NusG [Candidatus Trichorickettsia mobilis]WPY00444.1 Transcription termination/antitermination protein NusG [Candidatus Trichorickettsia mobilis]